MAKKQNKTEDLEPVELSAEDSDQDKKLTPMEEIFCLEYLKHFNATKAAISAGYSEKTARQIGYENLTKPYIRRRLRDSLDEILGDKTEDVKKIINELRIMAFSDIKDVVSWDSGKELIDKETGKVHSPFRTVIRDAADMGDKSRAISEVSESETELSSNRKVKMYDKLRAIELLGKFYKIFTDKIEHTNPDGNMKPQVFVYLPKNGRESE